MREKLFSKIIRFYNKLLGLFSFVIYEVKRIIRVENLYKKIATWTIYLVLFSILISQILVKSVEAATNEWLFTASEGYTLSDDSLMEIAGNKARLKVRNYTTDANTGALFHLDESEGDSVADSSANSNTGTAVDPNWLAAKLNNGLSLNGTTGKFSVPSSDSLSPTGANSIEAWTKFGSEFNSTSHNYQQTVVDKGDFRLYYDQISGQLTYELADTSATNWTQVAGNDFNGSWDTTGKNYVNRLEQIGSDIYAGTGDALGDAEVWKFNGTTWTMIGGDGVNGSWNSLTYENVNALETDGTNLYVGLGNSAGEAEVWKWDGNMWAKAGGDGANGSWAVNVYEFVYSMMWDGSNLYAGIGGSNGDAEVWKYNGGDDWDQIGGDSLNAGWDTGYNTVRSLVLDDSKIYAGLGDEAGEAEVWVWGGSSWEKVGGDGVGRGGTGASWANTTYEYVESLAFAGGKLYAGLGSGTAEGEVWRFDDPGWTQIAGDATGGWTNTVETVRSLAGNATTLYAGAGDGSGDSELWAYDISTTTWSKIGGDTVGWPGLGEANTYILKDILISGATVYAATGGANDGGVYSFTDSSWTFLGGDYYNNSWGFSSMAAITSMAVHNGKLYAGTGANGSTAYGYGQVWEYNGTTWTRIGGQGMNNGWAYNTIEDVRSLVSYKGSLYAGTGRGGSDADVWKWNDSTWEQVGGDTLAGSWIAGYDVVSSMAVMDGFLYAGLGLTVNESEVWQYDGSTWVKIGGDGERGSWTGVYENVSSMTVTGSTLYAGLGASAGDAEVWRYFGGAWARVGGDGVNSSWTDLTIEEVTSLTCYGGYLYAGLGNGGGDAEVWMYDGNTTWTKIGGDSMNSSWSDEYEIVSSITTYNGKLYAGLGNSAYDGEVWVYDGSSWAKVGGDAANNSWLSVPSYPAMEYAYALTVFDGKLYAGTGEGGGEAQIWSYGNNAVLRSAATSQDTGWHHIAATYDGTTMKMYIDGILNSSSLAEISMPQSGKPLLVGAGYGSDGYGISDGHFSGTVDEVRISNIARTLFNTSAYATDGQSVTLSTAVFTQDVKSWDGFSAEETLNGGSISYRISSDNGANWKFWDGNSWETSSSISQANLQADINSHIADFPSTSGGIKWQAVLDGDGNQQVALNSITLTYTPDISNPENVQTAHGYNSAEKSTELVSGNWYNYGSPYFSWTAATDVDGAGVEGYWVYFGTTIDATPSTAGVFQAGANYTASGMITGQTYYLRIQARDKAQNLSDSWAAFIYKYDSEVPDAIEYINVSPVGCSSSSTFGFSWDASSDDTSLIAGYQYKNGTSGAITDLVATSISLPPYQEGDNIFYARAKDNAGNFSSWQAAVYCSTGLATIIDGPTVDPGPSSLDVKWVSSKKTTSYVKVYDGNTYVSEQGHTEYAVSHSVKIVGLQSNKAYKYKLVWSDESGNLGESNWYKTKTSEQPRISSLRTEILSPTKVLVSWQTNHDASSVIKYGIDGYTTEMPLEGKATSFTKQLENLKGGNAYKLGIDAIAEDGTVFTAGDTFSMPPMPEITSLRFQPDSSSVSNTMKVTWRTNVATTSVLYYGPQGATKKEMASSEQVTDHSLNLNDLADSMLYEVIAQGTDVYGNTTKSDANQFTTPLDTRPPKVTDVTTESSNVGLNKQDKAQIAVSWKTDEPSSGYVEYSEGLSGTEYSSKTNDDKNYSNTRLTIISDLDPNKPYHLRVVSTDKNGNTSSSEDIMVIPGEVQKSILHTLLQAFGEAFGWIVELL